MHISHRLPRQPVGHIHKYDCVPTVRHVSLRKYGCELHGFVGVKQLLLAKSLGPTYKWPVKDEIWIYNQINRRTIHNKITLLSFSVFKSSPLMTITVSPLTVQFSKYVYFVFNSKTEFFIIIHSINFCFHTTYTGKCYSSLMMTITTMYNSLLK